MSQNTAQCPQPGLEPRLLDISRWAQWPWSHTPPTVLHSPSTKLFFWPEILCRIQSCTTKTSFASHCESLEIGPLDSKLKGRKWGNEYMYSTEIFSNTPTIKRGKLDWSWFIFMAKCPGVELPYGQHWSVFSHIVFTTSINVVEIIHGQYLKSFLLSQKRKKTFNRSFLLGNPSLIVICTIHVLRKLYKGSCSKGMTS